MIFKELKKEFLKELKSKDSDEYIFIETFYQKKLRKLPFKKLLKFYQKDYNKQAIKDLKNTLSEILINSWLDEFIKERGN